MKREVLIPLVVGCVIGGIILISFLTAMFSRNDNIRQPAVILSLIFLIGLIGFFVSYYVTKRTDEPELKGSSFPINFSIGDGALKGAILNIGNKPIEFLTGQSVSEPLTMGTEVKGSVILKNNKTLSFSGNITSTQNVFITEKGMKSINEIIPVRVYTSTPECSSTAVVGVIDGENIPLGLVGGPGFYTLPEREMKLTDGTNVVIPPSSQEGKGLELEAVGTGCTPGTCKNCARFDLQIINKVQS